MCRRSSRRCTVIPSAPPRCASTAAQTGSGSYVRRACRSVATWSMLTPSSIIDNSPVLHALTNSLVVLQRGEILHDAPAEDAPLLEIMIEHAAHQSFRFRRSLAVRITVGCERDQRCAANDGKRAARLGCKQPGAAIIGVMVALRRIDRRTRVDIVIEH